LGEREGPVGNRPARTAGRRFDAAAGVLWMLAGAAFGYLGLVQLGLTGEYAVRDLGSAAVNAVAVLAGVAGRARLICRASSSGLSISVAFAAAVVATGGYRPTACCSLTVRSNPCTSIGWPGLSVRDSSSALEPMRSPNPRGPSGTTGLGRHPTYRRELSVRDWSDKRLRLLGRCL
jgi:hypothetical protein